jgi:hypothetical protein
LTRDVVVHFRNCDIESTARYLEFGSVRALAEELDRLGIRIKLRRLAGGRTIGGGRFGVGALAHLLKNRLYIGEVGVS